MRTHYLTCQDSECERVYCVSRRDFEAQLAALQAENEALREVEKAVRGLLLNGTTRDPVRAALAKLDEVRG